MAHEREGNVCFYIRCLSFSFYFKIFQIFVVRIFFFSQLHHFCFGKTNFYIVLFRSVTLVVLFHATLRNYVNLS